MKREILRESEDFESGWITKMLFTPVLEDVGTQDLGLIGLQMNDEWYGYMVQQEVGREFRQEARASLATDDASVGREYNERLKHSADQMATGTGPVNYEKLRQIAELDE